MYFMKKGEPEKELYKNSGRLLVADYFDGRLWGLEYNEGINIVEIADGKKYMKARLPDSKENGVNSIVVGKDYLYIASGRKIYKYDKNDMERTVVDANFVGEYYSSYPYLFCDGKDVVYVNSNQDVVDSTNKAIMYHLKEGDLLVGYHDKNIFFIRYSAKDEGTYVVDLIIGENRLITHARCTYISSSGDKVFLATHPMMWWTNYYLLINTTLLWEDVTNGRPLLYGDAIWYDVKKKRMELYSSGILEWLGDYVVVKYMN